MKLTIALLFLGVIAATAQEPTKSRQGGELEAKIDSEGEGNDKAPSKTDKKNEGIAELGKRLRNVAAELKIVTKEQEGSDGEVSPYFLRVVTSLIKKLGRVITKRGEDIVKRPWKRIDSVFDALGADGGDGYSAYKMEDNIPHLSQVYKFLAEQVDNLGEILEIAGAERVA